MKEGMIMEGMMILMHTIVTTWKTAKIWILTKELRKLHLIPRGKGEVDNLGQGLYRLKMRLVKRQALMTVMVIKV
jgi:hypothetical protein